MVGYEGEAGAGPLILTGGAETKRILKRFEDRNIVQTAHADGTVRLWDAGHNDEVENEALLQVDVCRAVGRQEDVHITQTSFSGASGELTVGLQSGEMVVFRWGVCRKASDDAPGTQSNAEHVLTSITDRGDAALTERPSAIHAAQRSQRARVGGQAL